MESNTTFFFFFIPLQFGVAIYLTYFEVKKLSYSRQKADTHRPLQLVPSIDAVH
jgi:hypothetical protein